MKHIFEIKLIQNSALLMLKKTDIDLFIMSQTGTLTYPQLDITRLHGENGGRLSIKRIEKMGYVKSKKVDPCTNMKYYYLTSSGKKYVQKLFRDYLNLLNVDLDMKIPNSTYQLPHRICANDFYFAYISAPKAVPAVWIPEKKLFNTKDPNVHPPRADGYLNLLHHDYYIEQDMATQPEGTILSKIQQYIDQGILHHSSKNVLVFTIHCSPKPDDTVTSPQLVYRVLLKLLKAWTVYGEELTFSKIEERIDSDGTIRFLSSRDILLVRNLHMKYPFHSYTELLQLKEKFRKDQSYKEQYLKKQDAAFQKRFFSHFFSCHMKLSYLKFLFEKEVSVFAIPNHRISNEITHILTEEFNTGDLYKKILFQIGFDISLLHYAPHKKLNNSDILIKQAFTSDNLLIAIDNIHDLSTSVRIQTIMQKQNLNNRIFILLLTGNSNESKAYFEKTNRTQGNKHVSLFFYNMYEAERPYRYTVRNGDTVIQQYVSIYHDFYTGKVEIIDE